MQIKTPTSSTPDLNRLMRLKSRLEKQTTSEVRFDGASRAAYASEASNYRQLPIGVVIPRTIDDLVEAVASCAAEELPILPRGAGTSMCGQSVNAAVVIDHSKYLSKIDSVDAVRRLAMVEPGVICDELKKSAARAGLTFGPDPATHSRCTLGGMIGNNSCGAHSVMAGKTVENIERLEVLTYDGARFWVGPTDEEAYQEHLAAGGRRADIVRRLKELVDRHAPAIRSGFPKLKRRVSGYNLDQLLPENGFNIARALVGSEGTCATVLRAEARLVQNPKFRALVVLGFPDIFLAADAVPQLLPLGPIAMEGLDEGIIGGLRERGLKLADIAELPKGQAWIMVEFGADEDQAVRKVANQLRETSMFLPGAPIARVVTDSGLMNRLWTIRETGASATSLALDPRDTDPVVGWEDAAVEPAHLGAYLREFSALVDKFGYKTNLYGHFGDGCVHSRITFNLKSHEGVQHWREFLEQAARLVVKYGGSLSGEHGDGQAKGEFLPIMYSPEIMSVFAEFKQIWDPGNRMNPGKLIDPMPVDANLRLGPTYSRKPVDSPFTYFKGLGDQGFARASERCIGMGKCRSLDGGTMCPSFRATREEIYSTRGRARLFFEMLKGEAIQDGWESEEVKDSLDLCLACKGCKSDCPTHVDIARYKAEFLWRHHATKRRSLAETAVGRIGQWLPTATRFAPLINAALKNTAIRHAGKHFGLAPNVKFPTIASQSFRRGHTARRLSESATERHTNVVLWIDSFNNAFSPQVLDAAVMVLEHYNIGVHVLHRHVCCGRPFYDAGMLDEARANLTTILKQVEPFLWRHYPIVVLEPSCLSVFRDELPGLFPESKQASLLSQSVLTFAEIVERLNIELPDSAQAPHIHGHCHQKACGGMAAEQSLLKKLGAADQLLNTGCCGMAGAYGYNTKTAQVSEKIGREIWAPQLASVGKDGVVVADGFSCRSQAANVAGRPSLHLAEWMALQLRCKEAEGKEGLEELSQV